MSDLAPELKPVLAELLLSIADDKLMVGTRNSDWTGVGPMLEEDIAFSSLAQDEIAHAQSLYQLAGKLLGEDENALAFGRDVADYRCASIAEAPDNFDFGVALARQFYCDHFDDLRLARLANSSWKPLAELGKRLHAEEQVHVHHADGWIRRLGQGDAESRTRIQNALDALAPHAAALFEPTAGEDTLGDVYPAAPGDAFATWLDGLKAVAGPAGLSINVEPLPAGFTGGRRGVHTPDLTTLLDEMCEVYRQDPAASW